MVDGVHEAPSLLLFLDSFLSGGGWDFASQEVSTLGSVVTVTGDSPRLVGNQSQRVSLERMLVL